MSDNISAEIAGDQVHQYAVDPAKLYETLVDSGSELVFLLDTQGIIRFVNRRVEVISGFPTTQFIGRHFSEVVHPEDTERCRAMIEDVVGGGTPYTDFGFRVRLPDGRVYHLVANGSLVSTAAGPRVLGICRDMTESVELREQLVARNTALSSLNDIVMALTSSNSVDEGLQSALERILEELGLAAGAVVLNERNGGLRVHAHAGVDEDWHEGNHEATARLLGDVCDKLDGPVYIPSFAEFAEGDERIRNVMPPAHIHGGLVVPLRCGGEAVAVLLLGLPPPARFSLDQMEFVNLAAGLLGPAVENAMLRDAERVRSQQMEALAKEARHRIKNNLQMITGLLSICASERGPGSKALMRCVRQIGAISSIDEMLGPASSDEPIGLRECVLKIAEGAVMGTGRREDVELHVRGDDAELSADSATALGVIVNELVTNAVVHGLNDGRHGRIDVTIVSQGDRRTVEVADNGVGLPDGFAQPDGSGSNSGLGIVRSLARLGLGGNLEIACDAGKGTCARITF